LAHIDSPAQPKPGHYLFEVPGKSASVYLSLDVVDRLQQDVMRGFGAVPKRGAEVGGFLLGSATQDGRLIVEIEDYEVAPIEYKRGPSYQLSPSDLESLQATLERLRATTDSNLKPVGFFRSHTRDAAGLVEDDTEFLNRFFPEPNAIVLMIKPYATRVSTATFFFRENGVFPTEAPLVEFPFRRKDLAPGEETFASRISAIGKSTPQLMPRLEEADTETRRRSRDLALVPYDEAQPNEPQAAEFEDLPSRGAPDPRNEKARSGWVWVPLSFIFLLLGVLLGFQAALTLRPQPAAASDPFNLQLIVAREGDNLNVRWDRQGLAVRTARRGVLGIVDGSYHKTVELDPNQLQTGSVVYRHNSREVGFRLEVYPRDRDMIVESIQWKE
jgi:hypothetical protein